MKRVLALNILHTTLAWPLQGNFGHYFRMYYWYNNPVLIPETTAQVFMYFNWFSNNSWYLGS